MAVKLLQVLVLGVIAAAAVDDVPVAWVPPPRATLQCQIPDAARIRARGPPPPLESGEERPRAKPYIWRRDGEDLKKSSDGSLDVARRKDPSADGVYQCAVALGRHQGGLVLGYPVNLRFAHLEKQFSVQPANATVWQGQPYALTCDISSGPPANISWIKDGEPLPDDERYQLVNNQLIITEVTRKDAGLYRCRAANAMANKSRTSHGGRLQVEEAPPELGASFLGLQHEEAILVTRGTRVVLPCPVQGMPRPQLIWEHTPPGNQRTGELESTDELLLMPSIAVDQAGVYRCRVVGHLNLTKTFNVTITTPVNITHPPESKQAVRASTVRFNCTASGTPSPEVTWYKDGKLLKLQGRINVVMSADDKRLQQLLIRSVLSEDAGVYQCFARNAASVASAWATLNVTGGEAAPPDDVRCYPVGPHDVVVRWRKLPKDIKVIAYTVQYTHPGEKSYPTQPVTVSEATIDVKSTLTPYSFQVRAYLQTPSGTAVSDMSKSVTCQGQGVPIKLFEASNDSILVSWRDFYVENPGVQQWILQHKPENSSDEHNVTLDGYVYNYTLNVNPLESQQVRVLGTRSLPWLRQNLTLVPWTASSAASRPGPGEVRLVPENVEVTELNPHNFTVRWRCGEEYQCSTYTFKVCTRRVGGYDDCVESSGNYTTVTNLEPNSEYEVRVQAQLPTSQTQGDFSKPIPVSTPRAGQDNFRNISYRVINATAVNVSWDSAQKEYTVWHTYDYSLPLTQWNPVEAVGNSVLLTGLDPTKTLNVRVVGQDPPVQSRLLTIPVQIPEATDVRYSYEGEGVRVQWRGKGPRVVRYSQNLTRPLQTWHRVDVTDTTALITDVEPSLPVFVVVAAPGESARSHVLTIKPRPHAADHYDVYLGISIACGVLVACLLAGVAVFAWRKRKRRTPRRARSRPEGDGTEGEEMNSIGDRLANGGGSKDAGEPLLNGHVHITENPTQSKTPNGKVRKGQRYEEPLDVTRYDDADVTLDTVLDADTSSTTYHLLDTSRRPEFEEIPPNETFSKLPDDNMNSEVTRGEIPLENSKVLPTLQPNG